MDNSIAVAAIALAHVGGSFVPILLASSRKRLTRGAFALRSFGVFAVLAVAIVGSASVVCGNPFLSLGAVYLAGYVMLQLWSVHRTNDTGNSKWWNLLLVVPPAGAVWWVFLLARKGRPDPAAADVFE